MYIHTNTHTHKALEPKEGTGSQQLELKAIVSCVIWMLQTEPRSFGIATSTLDHRTTSPSCCFLWNGPVQSQKKKKKKTESKKRVFPHLSASPRWVSDSSELQWTFLLSASNTVWLWCIEGNKAIRSRSTLPQASARRGALGVTQLAERLAHRCEALGASPVPHTLYSRYTAQLESQHSKG